MEFKLLQNASAVIAETPVWDGRIGKLYWTETFSGTIHRLDPKTAQDETFPTGKTIGSAIPTTDLDTLLCAMDGGVCLLHLPTMKRKVIADLEQRDGFRYNDTRVDPRGRIFTSTVSRLYGTPEYLPELLGDFYMIDLDGRVFMIEDSINQYNGIAWNAAGDRMFVVDSHNAKLLCYHYNLDKGTEGRAAAIADLSPHGTPDGLCIDAQDHLYVCHWSGKITKWDAGGTLLQEINFPVPYVCCAGFGGADMRSLYVATSSFGYTPEDFAANPGAGGIFAALSPVPGQPDHFFPV